MAEHADGSGEALDAAVVIDETPDPDDEARLAAGRDQGAAAAHATAVNDLAAAQRKRDKAQAELAAAEQAVREAEIALGQFA